MKAVIVLCFLAVAAVVLARPNENENVKYTDKYDNIDLDEVIQNERLLEAYVDCVLGKGKCTQEGKELKTHMTDALGNGCAQCTDKQKEGTKKMMQFLINEKPEYWKQLCEKYDPDNKYAHKYEKEYKSLKEQKQ